jgi:hypothetical protein
MEAVAARPRNAGFRKSHISAGRRTLAIPQMPQKAPKYLQGAGIERRFTVFAGRMSKPAPSATATW